MTLPTKESIIRRHEENSYLDEPLPPTTARSSSELDVDQPTQDVPQSVIDRVEEALREGNTHYVDVPGIEALREQLAGHLNDFYGGEYEYEEVLVTAGPQEARFLTIQLIGDQFDAIAIPEVAHPGVRRALGVRDLEVHAIATERDRGYLPSVAGIRDALEQGVELLYLESPSRLTGATYEQAAVEGIAGLLRDHDASAIWDQGQAMWVPDGSYASLASGDGMAERTAVLGEAWPGKGLESWFAGYVGTANSDWFDPMESQKQVMSICTSTPTQYAAHEIGTQFSETHPPHRDALSESRAEAVSRATDAGVQPLPGDAANLLALPLSAAERERLEDAGIEFADGAAFGAPEAVRLSVTSDGSTTDAVSNLE